MCGIFGAVFQPEGQDADLPAALTALGHRGPDSSGILVRPGVSFGHTRLAILDLSPGGAQPMVSADGQCVVAFNGEIYNHHELRAELVGRGVTFRSRSDTEVIVEGYRTMGESFLERLDGMFAIGLFDFTRRRLVLIRDRVGKKPLFYAYDRGSLRFASQIRALFASGLAPQVDVQALPYLLGLGYVPSPTTLYGGVQQLAPASILTLEMGAEPRIRCYWSAPFDAEPLRVTFEDAKREVRRLVEQAVVRRLEADVPLGAFLSGGVDSSIVVGLMARASSQRVRTFSIGFAGDPAYDETSFGRIAARAFDTDHTEFTLEPSAFDLVDALVEAHDGPFGDSSAIPTAVVSMLTRRHVTVALGGDGGDELFCGYSRFLGAEYAERLPSALRDGAALLAGGLPETASWRSPVARAKRLSKTMTLSLPQRMLRWVSYFVDDLDQLLQPDVGRAVRLAAASEWADAVARECSRASPLSRALSYNFSSYLPYDLLVKADRASMLHSLELRSPFLDTALIEYVARLPDDFKRRGLETKWILRKAFADLVPQAILGRSKMGFGMPLGTWFRGPLRSYVHDTLGPSAALYEYVRPQFVAQLLEEHDTRRRDREYALWLLLTFERWLKLLPSWRHLTSIPSTANVAPGMSPAARA